MHTYVIVLLTGERLEIKGESILFGTDGFGIHNVPENQASPENAVAGFAIKNIAGYFIKESGRFQDEPIK